MAENNEYQVIIIGSGPAGYTSAIYTARANLKVKLFEGYASGGQLMITTDVENYPGFPEGVTGPELMDLFRRQAERFGVDMEAVDVTKVELTEGSPFKVWVDDTVYKADAVIIATGAVAKWLGLPSEKAMQGFGVSACATCDGFFFTGKEVCVVGGGDTALEEATYLTRHCSKVTLIHRRDELRGSKIMRQRAFNNEKIEFLWDTVVEEVMGTPDTGVTGLKVKNVKTGEISDYKTDGLFIAIGHKPSTDLFVGQIDLDETGYIHIPDTTTTATNIDGVFAAGDVRDPKYRQAISAAGMGCMAAIDVERWLETRNA